MLTVQHHQTFPLLLHPHHNPSPPSGHPSRTKLGAYLTQSQFQASVHSSSIVMTAAAQNLLCLQLAAQVRWCVWGGRGGGGACCACSWQHR